MTNMFKPKVPGPTAAPAPAPMEDPIKRLQIEGGTERSRTQMKSKGRKGLRIDLQGGSAGADGTGINIPRA